MNDNEHPDRLKRTRFLLLTVPSFELCFAYATESALLTGCALMLGASGFQIGLLGSALWMGRLGVIAAPFLVRLTGGRRRPLLLILTALRYLFWLPIVLLPILRPEGAVWYMLLFITLASLCAAPASVLQTSWTVAVVPKDDRNRFSGSQSALMLIAAIIMCPLAGYLIDSVGHERGFSLVFAIGIGIGLVAMIWYYLAHDPGLADNSMPSLSEQVRSALSRPLFRRFMVFYALQAMALTAIIFSINLIYLKFLGLSFVFITSWMAIGKVGKMVSCYLSGRASSRFGALANLKVGNFLLCLSLLLMFVAQPETLFIVPVFLVLFNFFDGCVDVPQNVLIMNWGNQEEPTVDLSILTVVAALGGMLGPFAGGLLVELLEGSSWSFGSYVFLPYHLVLAGSMGVMFLAMLFLPRTRDANERPTLALVQAAFRPLTFMREILRR